MLKIKFKKLFALFLALVLVMMQVFVAFAHEADAESTNQNVNPQANEEVLDDAHDHEHDEIFNNEEINEETNSETETETEFVGEELDEEVDEETEELEEPENPEDLVDEEIETKEETEVTNETNTDETNKETETELDEINEETEIEEIEDETNEQAEETEAEGEGSDVARSAAEKTEDDEIEVEIVDGEIVELNKNETTTETTSETEEEYLEEIAETVPVKNAEAGEPEISWVVKSHICEEDYIVNFIPNGTITSVTFNGEPQTLPSDTAVPFDLTIHPDYAGPIEIIAENENGTESALFPQRVAHTATYLNSLLPPTDYGLRTISAVCAECGANLGTAEFTTTQHVEKEWTDGGVKPFDEPTYSADWEVDPLVLEYTNNTKKGEEDDPVIANRPTATLKDSTGTEIFAIAYFTIKRNESKDPAPSGLVAHNASSATADDGLISGVDVDTMEWQTVATQPYQPIPSSPWTGLTPGNYLIRFKENDQHVASNAVTITVGYDQPPSPGGGGSGGGGGGGGGGGMGSISTNGAQVGMQLYAPIGATFPEVPAQLVLDEATNTMKAVTVANGATTYSKGWTLVHDNLQNADNWYYFDPETERMQTGWLTESGNVYYLYTQDDHLKGRLYSGWHTISGIVYYFSETNYALEHMMSAADASAKGIVTWEESIAAFQQGRILEATKGTQGLGIEGTGYNQQVEAEVQAQLQLQVQNAVTIELMREAFAARQDLIKAVERGTLSVEEAYAMSNGGQAAMTNFRSNFQSNQEIISQIANLISAYR